MRRWVVSGAISIIGLALFFYLVGRVGMATILQGIGEVGWGFVLLFFLAGISHLVKTRAWWWTLQPDHRPSYIRMVPIRWAGEAVSQLSFAGHIVGETTRAILLRSTVPLVEGVSSVVMDRGMFILTGCLVIVGGSGTALWLIRLPGSAQRSTAVVVGIFAALVALVFWALKRRQAVLSKVVGRIAARVGSSSPLKRALRGVEEVEQAIFRLYHESPRAFRFAFGLNLAGHGFSVLEVYLALWMLGVPVTLLEAFIIEALTKVVNFMGAVIPGNLGAYEGGNMLILSTLGYTTAAGLMLGLVRRLRGMAWTSVGLFYLLIRSWSR